MGTDYASFLGGSGSGGTKNFGHSEARSNITGDISFGGSSKREQLTFLVLAGLGFVALMVGLSLLLRGRR